MAAIGDGVTAETTTNTSRETQRVWPRHGLGVDMRQRYAFTGATAGGNLRCSRADRTTPWSAAVDGLFRARPRGPFNIKQGLFDCTTGTFRWRSFKPRNRSRIRTFTSDLREDVTIRAAPAAYLRHSTTA